jgi:LuxR family maltose regulon positive regulatory protein
MRSDAELAAKLEALPGSSWYADAQAALGTARYLAGAARQAVRPLRMAVREGAAFNPIAELAALGFLALIAIDQGDWQDAESYVAQADVRLAELGFGTYRRILPLFLARGRIAAYRGSPDAAQLQWQIAEMLDRMVPHRWMLVMASVILGEIALACHDFGATQQWSGRALEALRHYPDAGVFRSRAERLRVAVEQTLHAEPLTPAERRVLELLPTHLTEGQIAGQLFVSTNTVKTHLRGVYRKLEASSRAQAVERARELGLLPDA